MSLVAKLVLNQHLASIDSKVRNLGSQMRSSSHVVEDHHDFVHIQALVACIHAVEMYHSQANCHCSAMCLF